MRREIAGNWISGTVELVKHIFSGDDGSIRRGKTAPISISKDEQCDECDCDCYECRAKQAVAN